MGSCAMEHARRRSGDEQRLPVPHQPGRLQRSGIREAAGKRLATTVLGTAALQVSRTHRNEVVTIGFQSAATDVVAAASAARGAGTPTANVGASVAAGRRREEKISTTTVAGAVRYAQR